MKTLQKSIILLISFLNIATGQGPGSAAVPFLRIGVSPALGGTEAANAVFPSDDSFAFFYNPAQLGVFARDNNLAMQFYPSKTDWLPQFNFSDLTFNSRTLNAGYVLKNYINDNTDLNIGFGYMRTILDLGKSTIVDQYGNEKGSFNSSENYDAYAIVLGIKYYAYFALGYTYKKINSNLAPRGITVGTETIDGRADASAHDIGLLVSLPVLTEDDEWRIEEMDVIASACLGYAVTNIGDYVRYSKNAPGDPLPRIA